jgi:type II secretory pathway pseudopilin PulG
MSLLTPAAQTEQKSAKHVPHGEHGYALVALIGVMMFALILTTAAAPQVKKESQREREEEMLWRGHQIATAIAFYYSEHGRQWPKGLNELVQGTEVGTRKVRYLRPSALCDPMTPCSPGKVNWRLVHPGDGLPKDLYEAYKATMDRLQRESGIPPQTPAMFAELFAMARLGGLSLSGQQAGEAPPDANNGVPPGQEPPQDSGSGGGDDRLKTPDVIGVVSRKSEKMFRSYYGIDKYNEALFFPTIPAQAGGFLPPLALGNGIASAPTAPPRDQDGCINIGGQKTGCLSGGLCPPPKRINPQTGVCE